MIIGQRLVRKLADDKISKKDFAFSGSELDQELDYVREHYSDYLLGDPSVFEPNMAGEGFAGRVAVSEIFEPTEEDRKMILEGKLGLDMIDGLRKRGYLTMLDDALIKVYKGMTTMDEVRRVV